MNRKKSLEKWKVLKFKDCIVQLSTGLNPRKNFSLGHGSIRYITAKNLIGRGEIDFSTADYIDAEAKKIINKRSKIKAGDILFSSRAPIGQTYLISTEPSYFDIGESIFSIRANKEVITPEYLCLYLSSDYFIKSASKHVTGSVIQEIRIGNLMETEIVVPPIEMQRKIAECINSIDYKIQLNNHINKKFESMAKTIYDYWFLQFEFPNEEGKPYKSSGGKMIWNEELKREIPEGWKYLPIIQIADLYQPKTISESDFCPNGEFFVYGANGIVGLYNEYNHKNREIAICCRGASCGNYLMTLPKSWITGNSMVVNPYDEHYKEFLYYNLSKKRIFPYITGSAQPQITRTNLERMKVLIPSLNLINKFNVFAISIRTALENKTYENQKLTSLRDFLLPLLMNGQVGFKEVSE